LKTPLRVYENNRIVGGLVKEATGALSFRYDEQYLCSSYAFPVSMSLPLREEPFRGQRVKAVIENLLPDSDEIRRRLAEQVGAKDTNAYNLLSQIGRDCVGALQFVPGDIVLRSGTSITGKPIDEQTIERLLNNLARQPLGLDRNCEFRVAISGAQEKTALLYYQDRWWKPQGTTPTTHILKTQIGTLRNDVDLSNSVENEFYCLKLVAAFGLPTASAEIKKFGETTALVIERFD
jgi:serine/threonine-protein kinase HipA